jgi:hypothetical protein
VLADRVRAVAMGFPDEVLAFMEDLHAHHQPD